MTIVAALSRKEGYGLTPLEGMASGAAVLTSSEGIWDEIIRDGIDGYVVDTDDIDQTTEKLDLLIKIVLKQKSWVKMLQNTFQKIFPLKQKQKN